MKRMTVTALVFSLLPIGCVDQTDEDLGTYYELSFVDIAFIAVPVDSVHVVLTQVRGGTVKQDVPFQIAGDSAMGDTLKFTFTVQFGSYSPIPAPQKNILSSQDSVLIWYAHVGLHGIAPFATSPKGSRMTDLSTSPRPSYYSVQNLLITATPDKYISFESQLYPQD